MVVTGCGVGVLGWGGRVGECVLDKWHSLYGNTHYKHEYRVLNSIWPRSGLSEFRKNKTKQNNKKKKKKKNALQSVPQYSYESPLSNHTKISTKI